MNTVPIVTLSDVLDCVRRMLLVELFFQVE